MKKLIIFIFAFIFIGISLTHARNGNNIKNRFRLPPGFRFPSTRTPIRILQKPVGTIYIRGIKYNDHSKNTSLNQHYVNGGNTFTITSSSINFERMNNIRPQRIIVFLQDAARPANASGVTGFEMRGIRTNGRNLTVTVPNYPMFKGRTWHVAVFVYAGQPFHYANPGTITIQ